MRYVFGPIVILIYAVLLLMSVLLIGIYALFDTLLCWCEAWKADAFFNRLVFGRENKQ